MFLEHGQSVFVCPSLNGGKNFPAGAYSPLTQAMYFPLHNTCMTSTSLAEADAFDSLYAIRNSIQIAPGTQNVGTLRAISVETGETVWKHEQRAGMLSVVATGGGLLFAGDVNGRSITQPIDRGIARALWMPDGKSLIVPLNGKIARVDFSSGQAAEIAFTVNVEAGEGEHTATFPPKLISPRVLTCTPPGGLVLDPFCGTGRVLEVSLALGRRAIGFEKSDKFCRLSRSKTNAHGNETR